MSPLLAVVAWVPQMTSFGLDVFAILLQLESQLYMNEALPWCGLLLMSTCGHVDSL